MAKYAFGIHGPFSGKLGTVVGCTWKGIPYMRSLPKKRSTPVSAAEKTNREKFALAQLWLKPLTPFLRVGFKAYKERLEGFTAAKSHLLKNALELNGTTLRVNPEKVLLSYGSLEAPLEAHVSFTGDNRLQFSWQPSPSNSSNARDQAMLMAYCLPEKEAAYETHAAFREMGADELDLPTNFSGKPILVYISFVSADRNSQSMSVYLGEIFVPA